MLHKSSDHVTDCIVRAADTERRAREATDAQLRHDLLDIAKRWRHLAESYQFVESLDSFIAGQPPQPNVRFHPSEPASSEVGGDPRSTG